MGKGKAFAIIALIAAAGTAAAIVPMKLDIHLNKEKVYQGEELQKQDLQVKEISLLGIGRETTSYQYKVSFGDGTFHISASEGRLKGELSGTSITGTLKAEYSGNVHEGDSFKASSLDVRYNYSDGRTVKPEKIEYDAPETFTEDTKIHVSTEYGDIDVPVWVSTVNKIRIQYQTTVHEGDAFDNSLLKVDVAYSDGAIVEDVPFVCTNAPEYFTDSIDLTVSTAYGNGKLSITPVKISSAILQDVRLHSGEKFPGGDIVLLYEDETEAVAKADEVDYDMDFDEELEEGDLPVKFTWHGKKYEIIIQVYPGNKATEAVTTYADELESSIVNVTEDSIFATVTKADNYYLTHIITMDAGQQLKAGFASGIGYGYSESSDDAALRTGWVIGINGSNLSSLPSIIINDGNLQQDGETNGSEICSTLDGILFSPDPGMTGEELLSMGVTNVWWTDEPTLIQTGKEAEGIDDGPHNRTIIAMKTPGEYYILTTIGDGMEYADAISLLSDLEVTYARPLGGDDSEALMVRTNNILEQSPMLSDFLYFVGTK